MRASIIFPLEPLGAIEDSPAAEPGLVGSDLHLVEPGRPEQAEPRQQRRAFHSRCAEVADLLARIERYEDRVELYRTGVVSRQELATATALYPELMPELNGEWEWIAITLADNLD